MAYYLFPTKAYLTMDMQRDPNSILEQYVLEIDDTKFAAIAHTWAALEIEADRSQRFAAFRRYERALVKRYKTARNKRSVARGWRNAVEQITNGHDETA